MIEQWGYDETETNVHTITLDVSYSNTDYVIMGMGMGVYADANLICYANSVNQITLDTSNSKCKTSIYYYTIGY